MAMAEIRRGRAGGWRQALTSKWFWIASSAFVLVQLEYAYQVMLYHS
jgi:hypothetical protein